MRRIFVELGRMGSGQPDDIPSELDRRALHAQANAEEGDPAFTDVMNGFNFAFDAPLAEAAGDEDAVVTGKQLGSAFALDFLALDPAHADLTFMVNAGVVERLVNRLV